MSQYVFDYTMKIKGVQIPVLFWTPLTSIVWAKTVKTFSKISFVNHTGLERYEVSK